MFAGVKAKKSGAQNRQIKKKKDDDSEFYDERLENYKKQEWDRRLNGFWYYNNGIPLYLIMEFHYINTESQI